MRRRCSTCRSHPVGEVPLEALLGAIPSSPPPTEDIGFAVSDEEYADEVGRIIADEIGRGRAQTSQFAATTGNSTHAPAREAVMSAIRTERSK